MGNLSYRITPRRTHTSEAGYCSYFDYGASQITGWRHKQEDRYVCLPKFHENFSFFAVYDGHAGGQVVQYLTQFMHELILNELKKHNDPELALYLGFYTVDNSMRYITKKELDVIQDDLDIELEVPDQKERRDVLFGFRRAIAQAGTSMNDNADAAESDDKAESSIVSDDKTESLLPSSDKNDSNVGATEKNDSSVVSTEEDESALQSTEKNDSAVVSTEEDESALQSTERHECAEDSERDEPSSDDANVPGTSRELFSSNLDDLRSEIASTTMNELSSLFYLTQAPIAADESDEEYDPANDSNYLETSDKDSSGSDIEIVYETYAGRPVGNTQQFASEEDNEQKPMIVFESVKNKYAEQSESMENDVCAMEVDTKYAMSPTSPECITDRGISSEPPEIKVSPEKCMKVKRSRNEFGEFCGSTATVLLLSEKKIYLANVGDSRCVACINGEAVELSIDHKPSLEEERSRILEAGGTVSADDRVNGYLDMSRCLGDFAFKEKDGEPFQILSCEPHITTIDVTPDLEFIIIASDGIWNTMDTSEVIHYVKQRMQDTGMELQDICGEMFEAMLPSSPTEDGRGCDNMTAVLLKFKDFNAAYSASPISVKNIHRYNFEHSHVFPECEASSLGQTAMKMDCSPASPSDSTPTMDITDVPVETCFEGTPASTKVSPTTAIKTVKSRRQFRRHVSNSDSSTRIISTIVLDDSDDGIDNNNAYVGSGAIPVTACSYEQFIRGPMMDNTNNYMIEFFCTLENDLLKLNHYVRVCEPYHYHFEVLFKKYFSYAKTIADFSSTFLNVIIPSNDATLININMKFLFKILNQLYETADTLKKLIRRELHGG